jgi:hypothetical protein
MNNDIDSTQPVVEEKKKVGPPFKYDPQFHPQELTALMAKGYKDVEIFTEWNIARDTFYRWRREHEDFAEAYERGLPAAEKAWEDIGKAGMMGQIRGFNAAVWFGFMKKKFPEWKEANSNGVVVNNNTVNGNVSFFQGKSDQELKAFIKNNLKALEEQGLVLDAEFVEIVEDGCNKLEDKSITCQTDNS